MEAGFRSSEPLGFWLYQTPLSSYFFCCLRFFENVLISNFPFLYFLLVLVLYAIPLLFSTSPILLLDMSTFHSLPLTLMNMCVNLLSGLISSFFNSYSYLYNSVDRSWALSYLSVHTSVLCGCSHVLSNSNKTE